MKFCQIKRKNFKIVILFIFIILFFGLLFNNAKEAKAKIFNLPVPGSNITCEIDAETLEAAGAEFEKKVGISGKIEVEDALNAMITQNLKCSVNKGRGERIMDQIKSWTIDRLWKELIKSGDLAWRAALKFFLNNLAYDMATYLATGDKGQLPMFETEGWGGYLKNVADNTAGAFIEDLGKGMGTLKFNLCQPNSDVMIKINLGLGRQFRPKAPACTFSQLVNNWDAALNDKDFLPKFQDMFNPWSNDLGIALTLQTGIESEISRKVNEAAQERFGNQNFKDVKEAISGAIKTPGQLVKKAAEHVIDDSTASEKIRTGTILADSIDIFINTLIGKLIDKWLRKGLVTDFADTNRWNNLGRNSLTDPDAQNPAEGIAGAASRFRSLIEPNFKVRGDYNILAELTICPDPNKAGPTNCVIDEKFRQAIEKRLTVSQALEQGYLNGNGVFGFTADGLEPRFNEGYPYRSMLILRKFRIIPLGWEIAGQYIKDCQNNTDSAKCKQGNVGGTKNLSYLVNCAAAWCAGLIDPNWVLKAPQNFCKKEGAGPEILSEQVMGEGAGSSLSILRNDNYCADEQSCVKEKSDGSCQLYGYCTEERRRWDFNGKSCEPRDNTCQTFQFGEQTISYLQNTLDFAVCNAGNAGCEKYATSGSYNAESKSVNWNGDIDPIYLNKNAASCEAADQSCRGFIRIFPEKNETYDDIITAGIDQAYDRFSASGRIYEKLLPDYLVDKKIDGSRKDYDEGVCYDNQGRLKISAPAQCSNFVRQCQKQEAGCELYKNVIDGFKIPAIASSTDYCPAECVGYDTFIQKETTFDSSRAAYFIPKTTKTCSAESLGCDQFTNLDEVKKGGEAVEYYTYLRQCLEKKGNEADCGEFYNWEGSDESGYQLKVESLKINGAEPAVTEDDSALCGAEIYNYPPSNPAHNPDCRQFYNRAGGIFYHLYRRTISCSDNCHPYRRTELNIDQNIIVKESCLGEDKHWDGENNQCVVCKSGGVWSDDNSACIYMAIPGQGAVCAAAQNGCREYNGNTGNDIRNIFTDDFSGGITGGWTGAVEPSNEALILDADSKGNSLKVNSPFSAKRIVGNTVTEGKAYVLSFLAKASASADLNLSLVNDNGTKANFAKVVLSADWQIFQTNLIDLNHEATSSEYLLLEANLELETDNYYIDNITLTEIVDRYYLIKGSWNTPLACDSDQSDNLPGETLGCDQYTDRADKNHYLKSFNELCPESAVGCELMIDTENSSATTTEIFDNDGTIVTVPADSFTYAVYDQKKLCNKEAKGCALLGKSYKYEDTVLYGDIYLKNNPDKYNQILCGEPAVGCQTFTYGQGEKYFKDPGDQACEWRQEVGKGASQGWFKKKVKRCGLDVGAACLSDADCLPEVKCQLETADRSCPLDTDQGGLAKTLGLGGAGGRVSQPGNDNYGKWAGVCAAANSGCGEYIDPISRFNTNIIFNGSFADLDNNPLTIDGWGAGITQDIDLEPNTVYRLARLKQNDLLPDTLSIKCPAASALYELDNNNNLAGPTALIEVEAADYANSKIFYYKGEAKASCLVTAGSSAGVVELKPAVIDYQLAQNLDTQSCNGIVDFDKGCVLFNERSQEDANLAKLKWDADTGKITGDINDEDKDSNIILKVTPDRVCDKWLACKSYIKDEKGNNTCYDLGLCDAVDDKGDCLSFIISPKKNQIAEELGADKISNLAGYAKAGISRGSLGGDYYPLGAMEQKGEVANLANGGFEFYGSNDYPLGWNWSGQEAAKKPWDVNVFSVMNNPIAAQAEGIGYAREGRAFIKLGSSYDATSEDVDVLPMTDYIITAYVNTKNLKSGQAKIDIGDICQAGICVRARNSCTNNNDCPPIVSGVIAQALGNDWQFQVGTFKTDVDISKIKIKLYSSAGGLAGSEGNFYFDDVKIKPVLNSKDNWSTVQSCRLYPKTDSLACDYFEDSGKRQKGWPGYCLEYDRPPGNPNTCILWYPVDRVKGDSLEEGAGYMGKFPVYYCLSAGAASCSASNEALIRCDKIVRTVNSIGQNKFWSSHVYQGTDWYTANEPGSFIDYDNTGLNKVLVDATNKQYNYSYDQAPFGSIVPPFSETNNPFDWDSRTDSGVQPLYLEVPPKGQSDLARAGSPFYCNADQSCYLMKFHDGRTFKINSLNVELFMSAVGVYLLNFNGKSHGNGEWENKTLKIGNNAVFLYSDAEGGSDGKGECTNLMKAIIRLPNGENAVITKAGNETETGATPIINCGDDRVDGGIEDYAGGQFITKFEVTYNDQKTCKVNIVEGEGGGIDKAKKLFAQSYGAWEWNDKGICAGGLKNGQSCADNNACQGGLCSGYCVDIRTHDVTAISCDLKAEITKSCKGLDQGKCVNTTPEANICVNGNKNFLSCLTRDSNDCKGCVDQTFGYCIDNPFKCQGGANNGVGCLSDASCNSCDFSEGNCNPDTLKCVGGNNVGNNCETGIFCQADHTCSGGNKMGKYCDSNNDCNECRGCSGQTYGTCESADTCLGGARENLFCLNDRECNCSNTDLSTCNDIHCPNYLIGNCVRKKTCDAGCHIDEICNNNDVKPDNNKLCKSTQCHECLASFCSDGKTSCSNDANCSGICSSLGYKPVAQPAWGPPGANEELNNGLCISSPRPTGVYCAIPPTVSNIKVNAASGDVILTTSQFINLTFNSKVDSQQLPLVMYAIDWGGNEKTVMTGAEMRDRPEDSGNPHSLYHLYSYWDLKAKANRGITGIDCSTPGECKVKPKIQIKDNWGWCNKGKVINICGQGQWDNFDGWVVVKEK